MKNCKWSEDFDALIFSIRNTFNLGENKFLVNSGKDNLFYESSSEAIIYQPGSLSMTEQNTLRKFMQISLINSL